MSSAVRLGVAPPSNVRSFCEKLDMTWHVRDNNELQRVVVLASDEGPIIEQDVIRVNHSCDKDDMVRLGRDVEQSALSRGLRYHLEDRVIVRGNKTVVFNS